MAKNEKILSLSTYRNNSAENPIHRARFDFSPSFGPKRRNGGKKKSKKKKKKERRYSNSDRQEYSRCIYIRACHCFPDFPIKCPAWPAPSCPPANVPRFILFPFLLLSLSLSLSPPLSLPLPLPSPGHGCEWASTRFREFKNGKEFLERKVEDGERRRGWSRERGREGKREEDRASNAT